jgi:ferredoxin-NADP reductase
VRTTLEWQIATVTEIRPETAEVKTFVLALPGWQAHRPGQHYDVRLTAEDGYQAQRSYSIASDPARGGIVELTVERIPDGEVSPYLHDVVRPGDRFEVRGPIGGYFVWEADRGGPLLLIAGGSGVVPLMAMLRHRASADPTVPAAMLASWRSAEGIIYADELAALGAAGDGLRVVHTLTRSQPPGWRGYARRIDQPMLQEVLALLPPTPQVYICGPTALVENAASGLVGLGVPADRVRTERFGPTGT